MRFRYITMSDIPECARLYNDMQNERRPEELNYPLHTAHGEEEFTLTLARQLVAPTNNWFAIAGVVGSTIHENSEGHKQVHGGKVKGFISVSMAERVLGEPKRIAFIELVIVDSRFRLRDVARKLIHLASVEVVNRGAQVLEGIASPHSLGEDLYLKCGFKPYRLLMAYVTETGESRGDLPMPKHVAEPEPEKPKRGRPRKVQSDEAAR
jgi:GNAT superfamily N-acetyltransferase